MIRGKCDSCDNKAKSEWLIYHKDYCRTMKWCDNCKPKHPSPSLVKIYGK